MVACTKCGAELIGSRKFCAACGSPVKIEIVEKEPRVVSTTSSGLGPLAIDDAAPPLITGADMAAFSATVPAPPGGIPFPQEPARGSAPPPPPPAPPAVVVPPAPVPGHIPFELAATLDSASTASPAGVPVPSAPSTKVGPRGTAAMPQLQAAQAAPKPVIVATDQRGIDPFGVTHKPSGPSGVSPLASSAMLPQAPLPPSGAFGSAPQAVSSAQPGVAPQQPPPPPQAPPPQAPPPQAPPPQQRPPQYSGPQGQHAGYNQPGAALAPGRAVWVQWANGQRYPATVQQVAGTQCYVSFPDGQGRWVETAYVSPR